METIVMSEVHINKLYTSSEIFMTDIIFKNSTFI